MRTKIDEKEVGIKVAITKEICDMKNGKEVIKLEAEKMYEAILKYKADMEKENL